MTGHNQAAIAAIIAAGSRGVDLARQHDWGRYGAGVAAQASDTSSTGSIQRLSHFVDDWRALERRVTNPVEKAVVSKVEVGRVEMV